MVLRGPARPWELLHFSGRIFVRVIICRISCLFVHLKFKTTEVSVNELFWLKGLRRLAKNKKNTQMCSNYHTMSFVYWWEQELTLHAYIQFYVSTQLVETGTTLKVSAW